MYIQLGSCGGANCTGGIPILSPPDNIACVIIGPNLGSPHYPGVRRKLTPGQDLVFARFLMLLLHRVHVNRPIPYGAKILLLQKNAIKFHIRNI